MINVRISHPAHPERERQFSNRREAARYGVAYYLVDNAYASRRAASAAARAFEETGRAECEGFTFAEVA